LNRNSNKEYKIGMIAALTCSILWGVLPIYWQALRPIESSVIIFYRIALVGVVCFVAALIFYGWERIKAPLNQKGAKGKYFLAGLMITLCWSIYIWAVNADMVIQTCIGYYIEPLMVSLFGVFLFKEKLTKYKTTALILAFLGVLVILIYFHRLPLVALSLALTFSIYAAMKKSFQIEPILSLLYETMFLVPVALIIIVYLEWTGQGALGVGTPVQYGLLLCSGLFTAIPLGLFAMAVNKVTLVTMGLIEYISPSITLFIGIYIFKEAFDLVQFLAFVLIWIGLVIFTYGELRGYHKNRGLRI
jgi:chloramphenicol-sensitive protein RarD